MKNRELPKALLVSIITPDVSIEEASESLNELERLVTTLGFKVIAKESQRRPSTTGGTVVGEGKLQHLARYTGGPGVQERGSFSKRSKIVEKNEAEELALHGQEEETLEEFNLPEELANIVVFDCDLSPSQLRNVEGALGVEVLDRSGVIIEIFSRHAKTRTAKLQVEIARLNYLSPRLRETGGGTERQAGRGAGESQLELDRRNIRDRITELKAELVNVQKEQVSRRSTK